MKQWMLRYPRPARGWSEGLPIGNGRLGAVIYGGAGKEIWCLTETTYWSGQTERTPSRSGGKAGLEEMRKRFFAGDYETGERLASELLQPEKANFGTNLSVCDLILEAEEREEGYIRELNLNQAVVQASYTANGNTFIREVLVSHPDGVLAARLHSGQAGGLSFSLRIEGRTEDFAYQLPEEGLLSFTGRALEDIHSNGRCGAACQGLVRVIANGGTVSCEDGRIIVRHADEAFIYAAVNTDYRRKEEAWQLTSGRQLETAVAKGYDCLKRDHISDHSRLFGRVDIDLGGSPDICLLPTDERIRRLRSGLDDDPGLFALFFQYGRYLMIAGSREDSPLPMHLQGIWNDGEANRMAWSCDYHLDVNTEMNYYPAEAANLAECHLPLMDYIGRLAEAGRETARDFYGCEGWVAHVFSNAWGFTAPGWHYSWGLNVTGGLWLATHLREHYQYGLDRRFLAEEAYPVLKEAARFFLDYMTVHPKYGWLVTGPSNSPENSFYVNGNPDDVHVLSMGPTMDQVLVRELLQFCLEAAGELETDDGFREELLVAISMLPPLQKGRSGQLQEWLEDHGEAQPDHRHLSHLFSLYPGNQITPETTPDLCRAARTTLETRMRGENLEDVEFTLALFAASLARLGDGGKAREQLAYLIGQLCFDNLLTYSKPGIAGAETNIFVADGNFGGAAAIAEMLLQSRTGSLHLLPALPAQWPTGRVTGLRAKGNAEVDMAWENGELTEAVVRAFSAGEMVVCQGERSVLLHAEAGAVYRIDRNLQMIR